MRPKTRDTPQSRGMGWRTGLGPKWATTLGTTLASGVSQIFFQSGIVTGILTLAALALADWRMAVLALLGTTSSTLAGRLLRVPEPELRAGLQGFCGALVGAAAFSILQGQPLGYLVAVLGGAACAPLTVSVAWLFGRSPLKPLRLPPTTAPFCTVAVSIYWLTHGSHAGNAAADPQGSVAWQFSRSILTNISEVVLVNSVPAGALLLAALFLVRWKLGVAALLGSVIGSVFALATHQDVGELGRGLLGYSAVLTAIAMAAVFLQGRWEPWLMALAGALLTAVVTLLMRPLPGPVFTWPYVLTTWGLLAAIQLVPRMRRLRIA